MTDEERLATQEIKNMPEVGDQTLATDALMDDAGTFGGVARAHKGPGSTQQLLQPFLAAGAD